MYKNIFAFAAVLLVSVLSRGATCENRVAELVSGLLKYEHSASIVPCVSGDRRDCLEVNPLTVQGADGNTTFSAEYFFGGNYPNIDEYTVTLTPECALVSLSVFRN